MDKINLSTITYLKLKYNNKVKASDRPKIQGSQDAYNVFINLWDMEMIGHVESMKIMLLNKANRVLGIAEIAQGGTGGCVVDGKVILQYAIYFLHKQTLEHGLVAIIFGIPAVVIGGAAIYAIFNHMGDEEK